MGGSGSRSAQELHRSPPCTRLHCPDASRRQPRTAVGLRKCRQGPSKAPPQQQYRMVTVQKDAALRKGAAAVGRLRAGCESFQGSGDVSGPTAQVAGVKAQDDLARHRCLQRGDGSFLWKTGSGVISEMAHLTAGKQRMEKPPPVPRPRSPRQPEARNATRKGAAPAVGHVSPPGPPPPPVTAYAYRLDAARRDVSASYAGSSTSSPSSLAPGDSGISSSPSRVSLQNHLDDCEGEKCAQPQSPRPPAWKVRGFRQDEIPNDLHQRFCEEIKSRYQLQTEEDRRRRLLAIMLMDALVSERMASSVGREIGAPHRRLRQRPQRSWDTSGKRGGDRTNTSEMRSHLSSWAAESKSGNGEGRNSTHSGRDDIAFRRRVPVDRYPKYVVTNGCTDILQQGVEKSNYGSLNDANVRQLPENYSHENNHEQGQIYGISSEKRNMETYEIEKYDAHQANTCPTHIKEKRKDTDKERLPNEWRNARGEIEFVNRKVDVSDFQTMMSRGKRYGQNEKESFIVHGWYGEREGLHEQEQNVPDNLLLQAGQWNKNDIKDVGTEAQLRDSQQSAGRNIEEGNASVQGSTASDFAAKALLRKDNVVMQLLLGGYFKHEHNQPDWPRIGALRRTNNHLDVSIRSCRYPVEKQSVETQTLPVHVSRRLLHADKPRVEVAPKIEIDHRGGLTRYYSLGREGSGGSLMSSETPATPRRPQAGGDEGLPSEERRPRYLVPERPPPAPSWESQRSHSDRSSHGGGPNAQWISPDTAVISSHYNRHSSEAQTLARHMAGNSTSSGPTRGLALNREPNVNSGSHQGNNTSNEYQSKESGRAVDHKQGGKSAWNGQFVPMAHSTPQERTVNEVRVKTGQLFSSKKSNAETTNVTHRLAVSDRKPLTPEEELAYGLDTSNQYNHRVLLDDPPADFSRASKGRSTPFSNPNAHGDEFYHQIDHWGGDEIKQKPEHYSDQHCQGKIPRRFTTRHSRHSRHDRNSTKRTNQEDEFSESDSGSEERITQCNIQPLQRVGGETDISNSHRKKDNFDNLDNVRSDCKGDSKRRFRHNYRSKTIVQDARQEETRDDAHVLFGSTGPSSDSITKSSMSLLCHCCREEAQATSFDQCNPRKFISDRKTVEKRDSRRSVDKSPACATQVKPSATVVRNADCRAKQEVLYEHNDQHGEDIRHCRSTCCCTCHKTLRPTRFQPDVSGRQGTHVAKRAQCSGIAPASDTPCSCHDQQSVQCEADGRGLCGACRREMRSRSDGAASEKRSFHECYCGSRRVCYSILEDEEEAAAAAADEAKGSRCDFAHALSFFHNRSSNTWS